MAIAAKDVMQLANITLNDDGLVRWTAPELKDYLNDGMREIATIKPTAITDTVELTLVQGTRQVLDLTKYISIQRVTRNLDTVDTDPTGRGGGLAIRPVRRETLDATMPGWQDPNVLPYAKIVDHVLVDIANPRRVSDLLCMSNLAHASPTKEHDDNDDFQETTGRAAQRR